MTGITATPNENRPAAGIVLVLIAYLLFSTIDTSAKWLVLSGIPVLQVVFMRYAGHFVISSGIMFKRGFDVGRLATKQPLLVVARAVFLMLGTTANFMALEYVSLTLASAVMFSAPIFVCLLSGPMLGEKVGVWRWSAIALGFVGVLIAIRPFDDSFHWAMSLSLFSVFSYSLYLILTRKLSDTVATTTMQFYTGAVGTLCLLPFALSNWVTPENWATWGLMVVLGIGGWGGHELLTRAFGFAEASRLTPFSYVILLYMTFWSFWIFDELPDIWTLSGAAIIIAAGVFIWAREKQHQRKRLLPT